MGEAKGELAILNVGDGDTKLSFDPTKPEETKRASRVLKDLIRRGFAILIEVGSDEKGPLYRRAHDFDENTSEYIIAGDPSDASSETPAHDEKQASAPRQRRKGKTVSTRRIPAASTNSVAIARTAGG